MAKKKASELTEKPVKKLVVNKLIAFPEDLLNEVQEYYINRLVKDKAEGEGNRAYSFRKAVLELIEKGLKNQ